MLVDRDAVEAELGGELQFVEIAVVKPVTFHRIEIGVGQHDPIGAVFLLIIHIQIGVRHQMKEQDFHGRSLSMNWETVSAKRSGRSTATRCPQPGSTVSCAPVMSDCSAVACAGGMSRSPSPQMIWVGTVMRCSQVASFG